MSLLVGERRKNTSLLHKETLVFPVALSIFICGEWVAEIVSGLVLWKSGSQQARRWLATVVGHCLHRTGLIP